MTMPRSVKIGGSLALAGVAALALGARPREESRGGRDAGCAYTPTNTLKSIGENIWIVDGEPIMAMGLTVPVRMTVIRLEDGSTVLHSPVRHTPGLARTIDELGPVRHLVAPTTAHWKFVSDWQRACPEAVTWAVPGLRKRLQVRMSGLRLDRDLGDEAPAAWSREIRQGLVRGLGLHEVYFFHRPSRTLVLTDLVDNLRPSSLPPLTAAAVRLARATRGRPAIHVRAAILLGGHRARRAIGEMVALEPERVVFAHGDWFAENGAARLRGAFEWL